MKKTIMLSAMLAAIIGLSGCSSTRGGTDAMGCALGVAMWPVTVTGCIMSPIYGGGCSPCL